MTTYKDAGEWARRNQELTARALRLDVQRKTGSISPQQDSQQSRQLVQDRLDHTMATELLGKMLKEQRLEREGAAKRQAQVDEIAAMLERGDAAERARIGGRDDQNDWRYIQTFNATQFLGPVAGIPSLTHLGAKLHAIAKFDKPAPLTLAWLEASWKSEAVRQIFVQLNHKADSALTEWLRAQSRGAEVPVRILGEREPSKWVKDAAAMAGKSFILGVIGFLATVEVGNEVEAEVIHGDQDATHAIHITPLGETVPIEIDHKGGDRTVKGLFSGLKNLQGKRFKAKVARISLIQPRLIQVDWTFASGTSFV